MLKEQEWNTISNILLDLYTLNDIDVFSKRIMKMFRMLIPYTKGWFLMLDDDQNIDENTSYFIGFDEDGKDKYLKKYYDKDYIKYLYDFNSYTVTYRDTDILDNSVRENTEFYKNFLLPKDIIYGCGIMIVRNGRITAFLNLFRDKKAGDFSDKDVYILNILKKHIENMIYNVTQFSRANVSVNRSLDDFAKKYGLTEREKNVCAMLNKGMSNQEIADKLYISVSTVKKHIYNLFNKTDVSSRGMLVSLFLNQ